MINKLQRTIGWSENLVFIKIIPKRKHDKCSFKNLLFSEKLETWNSKTILTVISLLEFMRIRLDSVIHRRAHQPHYLQQTSAQGKHVVGTYTRDNSSKSPCNTLRHTMDVNQSGYLKNRAFCVIARYEVRHLWTIRLVCGLRETDDVTWNLDENANDSGILFFN